jgi:NAD(P)-dependent dehydrogenase (short-subunit alcohol dehydrogenase family)
MTTTTASAVPVELSSRCIRTTVMKLEGQRVLVAGGSSSIGFAIAGALRTKGAKVVITGRRLGRCGRATQGRWIGHRDRADVGTDEGRALTLQQELNTSRKKIISA